jgi:hypothetical protein
MALMTVMLFMMALMIAEVRNGHSDLDCNDGIEESIPSMYKRKEPLEL